jgi:hypothetical protein
LSTNELRQVSEIGQNHTPQLATQFCGKTASKLSLFISDRPSQWCI